GFDVLVRPKALRPLQRMGCIDSLLDLTRRHPGKLTLRVSLDHHTKELHEKERGEGTWEKTIAGIDWISRNAIPFTIAGRTCWGENEADARAGYAALIEQRGWPLDAADRSRLILFPEMDGKLNVPEITTACWGILNKKPSDMMCATSRMVVKRKDAEKPVVVPCTLLPYEPAFEMGATLAEAARADGGMFDHGAVKLCHPHCAKFCVLGGGSCS
ncbi:MAG: radical SAM protein, partial [Hyphomicrobiaceae bacterium]